MIVGVRYVAALHWDFADWSLSLFGSLAALPFPSDLAPTPREMWIFIDLQSEIAMEEISLMKMIQTCKETQTDIGQTCLEKMTNELSYIGKKSRRHEPA
jgi:hypothetical protein